MFQLYGNPMMEDSQLQHCFVREVDPTHFDQDAFESLVRLHYRGQERMKKQ